VTELGKCWGERSPEALLLLSHMHWDHIQGFPFFTPWFNPGGEFHLWATPREGQSLQRILSQQMTRPTFPVGLDILPARLHFRDLASCGSAQLGELTLRWTEMHHPSGSTAYRIEYGKTSVVVSGDTEIQLGGREALIELAQGADLLIMDSQYFPAEYPARRGFGHSTPLDALEVAVAAGVRQLLLTHHDPSHDDARLDAKRSLARLHTPENLYVDNAYDGLSWEIRPRGYAASREHNLISAAA